MTASFMNSSTLPWTLNFLTATIWPSTSMPLYTVPWPPLPRTLFTLKRSVAFSRSFKLKSLVLSKLTSPEDNLCCSNKPPFCLKYFCLSFCVLRFLKNLYRNHMPMRRKMHPRLEETPTYNMLIRIQLQIWYTIKYDFM